MLPRDDEDTQTLIGLGLTSVQARIYLTLSKLGKATIKSLAEASKMDRGNVSRVIVKLQNLSLVEKILTTPTMYKCVPLQETITTLLERKKKDFAITELRAKDLLVRHENENVNGTLELESQFVLVPSGSPCMRKLSEMMGRLEHSHCLIMHWSEIRKISVKDSLIMWKSLMKRGISVRVLAYKEEQEPIPATLETLNKDPLFKIRFVSAPPRCTLSTYDDKEAFISVTPKIFCGSPSLWVNNPNFASIFQNYFETLWQSAASPPTPKPDSKKK